MRITRILAVSTALIAFAALANAQDKGGKKKGGGGPPPMLTVKVDAFADGARVPEKFTCAAGQGSPSPAISWSGGPGGAGR